MAIKAIIIMYVFSTSSQTVFLATTTTTEVPMPNATSEKTTQTDATSETTQTNAPPETTQTNASPETTQTPILSIALGGTIGGLVLLILLLIVVILVCVAKRKSLKQKQQIDDPTYDFPHDLRPPPLPQSRTNQIQVTTNTAYASATSLNDAPDAIYETLLDTTNPAYGLTLSASAGISVDTNSAYGLTLSAGGGISVDTNSAYGMVKDIRTIATNAAQQQDETPPATNPTFEQLSKRF